jgi:hypothetical protein
MRVLRGVYYLLALVLIALSAVLLVMSFKLIGIWRAEL